MPDDDMSLHSDMKRMKKKWIYYCYTAIHSDCLKMAWPKGKRRSGTTKKTTAEIKPDKPAGDSLVCIHCRERVSFDGSLPATDYEKHLSKFDFILNHHVWISVHEGVENVLYMLLEKGEKNFCFKNTYIIHAYFSTYKTKIRSNYLFWI